MPTPFAHKSARWVLTTPSRAARWARAGSPREREWCYFGADAAQRARLEGVLAPAKRVELAEGLTRVAYDEKQPFLDWLLEVGRHQPDHVSWWSSTVATCSPLQTDMFLLACYTRLLEAWLREPPPGPQRLIVVEDPWLGLTLRRHVQRDSRVVCDGVGFLACARDAVLRIGKAPRVALATLYSAVRSFVLTRRLFPRVADLAPGHPPGSTLLYTWIRPESFSAPGRLNDPWTGRLDTILNHQDGRVVRLSSSDIPPALLRRLQRHGVPCLVTPRHLTLGDLVRALGAWFRVQRLERLPRYQGWDYRWLLAREELREWSRSDFWHYRLGYFATRRIAARYGRQVQSVIYPFENQPWEKLFCLAWRECAPHVKLIGYQHSWVPPLLLPYALANGAWDLLPLPDQIVTSSEFNLERLSDGGYPAEQLLNGGALRHEYLHTKLDEIARQRAARAEGHGGEAPTVLVTFPLSRPHAGSLLADFLSAFREPLILKPGRDGTVQFQLKFHPVLPLGHLLPAGVALPPWMTIVHAPMEQLLPGTDLLLYVGPTSSWWEAFLSGVPVLKYRTDLIDIDAGNQADAMPVPVCSGATLRASLDRLLRGDRPAAGRPPAGLVEKMYGRVNEALWVSVTRGRPLPAGSSG